MSEYTRESLYLEMAKYYLENDSVLSQMYKDSASLISGLERNLFEKNKNLMAEEFFNVYNNREGKETSGFTESVNISFMEKISEKNDRNGERKRYNYSQLFYFLVNSIIENQDKIIESKIIDIQKISQSDYEKNKDKDKTKEWKQVFLSYAYIDKGISLALFNSLLSYNIYLYVDWMHNNKISDGISLKNILEKELGKSDKLLFLRTINSELRVFGGPMVRQWCAWELGCYYRINKGNKYYLDFYGSPIVSSSSTSANNLLLHSLKQLTSFKDLK